MKILQVAADGKPGGGTTHVLQLVDHLDECFESALLTDAGSYLEKQSRERQLRTFNGDFFRSRLGRCGPQAISSAIKSFQPDIVHLHGGRAAFFASWLKLQLPTIYHVHGYHFSRKKWLLRKGAILAERRNGASSTHVIFECEHDRDAALKHRLLPKGKSHSIVSNSISATARDAAKLPRVKGRVGFVGRLVYQKRPELFVEVIKRLPDCTGYLIGGGPLRDNIRKLIADYGLDSRIEMTGELSHPESASMTTSFDVLVMTSRWEGMCLQPLEAMWHDVPVVAMRVGGLNEILDRGVAGMLVDESQTAADDLAACVTRLLDNQKLRDDISAAARDRVESHYTESVMVERIEKIYRELEAFSKLD